MTQLEALGLVLFAIWLSSLGIQLASVAAALTQAAHRRRRAADGGARPPVSIVVPTRETDPAFRQRLAELAGLVYPTFEIIIAAERRESAVDAAIAALGPDRAKRVRVSIDGTRHTFNPKVNVEVAAYRAAAHDVILLTDDNVVSPPDRLAALLPHLHGEVGLVSTAAIGVEPLGLVAEIEAAFMNGYGARYLLAADRIGRSIAMGKTLLFRRSDLDRAGGILALANGMAEDSVIRERLASVGLATALAPEPARQPLGRRRFAAMFARQLRWMAARRWHTPFAFWTELMQASMLAGLAAGCAAQLLFGGGFVLGLAGTWAIWLGLDFACTRALGWPLFWRYPLAWLLRETLLPALWLMTLTRRTVDWRGNEVPLRPRIAALGGD